VTEPRGHKFPYSFGDAVLSTRPTVRDDGSLGFTLRGFINSTEGTYEIGPNPKTKVIYHRSFRKEEQG